MKLREVKKEKYLGWVPMTIYLMELKHTLMGFFPVIEKSSRKVVLCKKREDLQKIWEKLPRSQVDISEHECVVNVKEGLVLPLNGPKGDDTDTDSFCLVLDLEKYLAGSKVNELLSYAPGLVGSQTSYAVFPEIKD